jgi:beta-lactam-binding protein with PASTA domain
VPGGFTVTITNPSGGVLVPDVFELNPAAAAKALEAVGLVPAFPHQDPKKSSWVKEQSPSAGTLVPKGTTVNMTLATGPIQ